MIELRKLESWDAYLPGLLFSRLGLRIADYDIDRVATGKMNFVFRVRTDKGTFFLKQALPGTTADETIGPALKTVSAERLEYERNCIAEITRILPDGVKIPTVHHYDPLNRILLLSDVAGNNGKLLESVLLGGVFDVATASAVGRFIGAVHRRTWGSRRSIRGSRQRDHQNWERFLKIRTKGILTDLIRPEITKKLHDLYAHSLRRHTHNVLILMDCCPKNIVARKSADIGVFDFELASQIGDPAYDLGFFVGHYLVHAILENVPAASLQAVAGSMRAYTGEVKGASFNRGLMARVLKFAAATLIYRVAGASRLNYIKPEFVPKLLEKSGAILCMDFNGGPEEAISLVADTLTEDLH